ncbi:hypothetical protein A9Q76_00605 [Arcobacter sp. 31_11_sub10_T18]|nr:hypothetical protein A9Q76_00605 [Arcobacter sp. 31_11_sub10_T18]
MSDIRSRLIEATFQEVYSKGYNGASLASILESAKAKKGSMYHYFSSKKEMVLVMIEEKIRTRVEQNWVKLENCEKDILNLLISIIKESANRDFTKGCPLGNLLQECSCEDKDFSDILNEIFSNWSALFEQTLKKAHQNGEIIEINYKNTALFLISSIEGALLISKQSGSSKEFDICMKQLEIYLLGFKKNS